MKHGRLWARSPAPPNLSTGIHQLPPCFLGARSEAIFSDFDAFLLLASRFAKVLDREHTVRDVRAGCKYSLDMRSLPEMARVLGLPLSDCLSWAVNQHKVGNTATFVHVANFPCIRGYKLPLGSEQRCIQISGLDGLDTDSMHCVHLPITEWFEGDWTTGFEFERTPDASCCHHWKDDQAKTEELEGSYQIEWKWPSVQMRNQGVGAMYISVPRILLSGRATDRAMNSLRARMHQEEQ